MSFIFASSRSRVSCGKLAQAPTPRKRHRKSGKQAWACLVLSSAFALAGGALLEGCSAEGTASEQRVLLRTRVELAPLESASFVTDAGFRIYLEQAILVAGPFYYFDGVPPIAVRPVEQRWGFVKRWFGVATAHAHPGHYSAGHVMGQMLEFTSIDLLAGPTQVADGEGITGVYRSARFSYNSAPSGELSSALEDHVAVVSGRAEKANHEPRFFRATATFSELEKHAAKGRVDGCVLEAARVSGDGTVTVRVNPKIWLDLVDFTELEVGSLETPTEFQPGSQPKIAFTQGLAQLSAYEFRFEPLSN